MRRFFQRRFTVVLSAAALGWSSSLCRKERTMKSRIVTLLAASLLAVLAATPAFAQRQLELTPQIGWQWGGTLDFPNGDVHVNAAINYGGVLGIPLRPGYDAELSYTYQGSEVKARPRGAPEFKLFDLGTHYMQIAGV